MTVITSEKDAAELRLTIVAEFDATPEQVWDVWEDARKLERWWGPPTYPATYVRHDFVVGGQSRYYMTGPQGDTPHGWLQVEALDKPKRIEFLNGLAGDDGEPMPGMQPMPSYATFEAVGSRTRMTVVTQFRSIEHMETMLGMGMQEGLVGAMGQIDALLAPAVA